MNGKTITNYINKVMSKFSKIIKLRLLILMTLAPVLIVSGVFCSDSEKSETIDNGTPTKEWIADGTISSGEYAWTGIYGDWEINWRTDDQYIYAGIKVKTIGWIGLGIKPDSKMENADIILGFVKDGQTTIYDMFSTGREGPHPLDTQLGGTDDILEFGGDELDGYTTIEFKRALNTGDTYDKPLSAGVNKIIWSYGAADDSTQHAEEGHGELQL